LALCRTAETAMALERYRLGHDGQLPASLNTLAPVYLNQVPLDPFNGQPLRFKRLPKGYAIYSVGADRQDDGAKQSGSDGTGDETFTVER
ncbi:MAG TPA: hypothetical protein VNT26_21310, partial [Candidatus Sulfotelmatobacter sp.]|nr:hypothetical protein [Candidatus Sulfotelmatobacter sp.]